MLDVHLHDLPIEQKCQKHFSQVSTGHLCNGWRCTREILFATRCINSGFQHFCQKNSGEQETLWEKKTLCKIEAFKSQVLSVLSKYLLFCGDLQDIGQMDKSRILYDISYLYFFLFGYLLSYVYLFLIYMFSYLDLSTPMFT